jgi:hypothetical protein
VAQNLRDSLRRELARSTRTRGVIGQALLSAEEQHGFSSLWSLQATPRQKGETA